MYKARAKADLLTRFWAKVDQSAGPNACWPWTGAFNRPSEAFRRKHAAGKTRRPVFWVAAGLVVYAHRLALSLTDGVGLDDRAGLHACHRCGNYVCCNQRHLYWGTPDENRADRYGVRDATQPAFTEDRL